MQPVSVPSDSRDVLTTVVVECPTVPANPEDPPTRIPPTFTVCGSIGAHLLRRDDKVGGYILLAFECEDGSKHCSSSLLAVDIKTGKWCGQVTLPAGCTGTGNLYAHYYATDPTLGGNPNQTGFCCEARDTSRVPTRLVPGLVVDATATDDCATHCDCR